MAIFTAVKNKKQTAGAMKGTMKYMTNLQKTSYENQVLNSGFMVGQPKIHHLHDG